MRLFLQGVAAAAVFLVSTGLAGAEPVSSKKVGIVTSFFPLFIMVKNVVGDEDGVSVRNLAAPRTGCLHDVALTTEDMRVLGEADIFVANGAEMESYLNRVAENFSDLRIVRLTDGLPLLRDAEGHVNAHVWVSLTGAMAMVRNLVDGLSIHDPERAPVYRKNGEAYLVELEALRDRMKAVLASRVRVPVATFHEAFGYFAEEFGIEVATVVEREPGTTPSARELARTIDLVRAGKVRVLFVEPQYPSEVARVIAEETGVRVFILDPAVTGSDDKDAYLRAMERNFSVLQEAFLEA